MYNIKLDILGEVRKNKYCEVLKLEDIGISESEILEISDKVEDVDIIRIIRLNVGNSLCPLKMKKKYISEYGYLLMSKILYVNNEKQYIFI